MKISWCGETCFEISCSSSDKEGVLISIDEKGDKKSKADIVLKTHEFNSSNSKKDGQFIVSSFGEYESKEVFVQAVPSLNLEKKKNIIFLIEAEGIRVCHLGLLGESDLSEEQLEAIGRVDILLTPIDGDKTINFKEAERIIAKIEPKIVIPMAFKKKETLNTFLKAMGEKEIASQDKLSISKKNISSESEKIEIIVLESK
ncbi:MAG: MBL fold metallo-hydrolase [Candidatus Microsyncoccus archaeolyticus]|nr:MAG: MBL fold metallo-hydrolase [Candidatus Parcubacteria bacterium]